MPDRPAVLITGASKGVGAATALAFSHAGYDVGVNFNGDRAGADRTVARCKRAGADARALQADVSDADAVAEMFLRLDDALGPLKCLVNNAGVIGGASTLADLKPETLAATFATNVFGTVHCLTQAVRRMRTDTGGAGGTIVNISSIAATLGSPGEYVHYAASKGAVETLTVGAGKELGPLGIRVAAIRMGTTATDLHAREGNPSRPATIAAVTPLGRIAETSDVADAILWLASDKARFVSGTVLTLAGGLTP